MAEVQGFIRIAHHDMLQVFESILIQNGFGSDKAKICAEVFATNSLEGVYTHGVNRFAKFIAFVRQGYVRPDQQATLVDASGGFQRWDGRFGPGPINAILCSDAAMALSRENTIGCVSLANTNHWMRAGYYGWRAARAGFAFIAWTNTLGNMPAWGATDSRLGNNPIVFAVPYGDDAIVMDTAMSQYSYGAIDLYTLKNEKLPTMGGYDAEGNLTDEPAKIAASRRVLPIGFWKGAGMSLLLDILATILSGGLSSHEISKLPVEYGMSQVFVAIDLKKLSHSSTIHQSIQKVIEDYHQSAPVTKDKPVRYPGENLEKTRRTNLKEGIPVAVKVWEEIKRL